MIDITPDIYDSNQHDSFLQYSRDLQQYDDITKFVYMLHFVFNRPQLAQNWSNQSKDLKQLYTVLSSLFDEE